MYIRKLLAMSIALFVLSLLAPSHLLAQSKPQNVPSDILRNELKVDLLGMIQGEAAVAYERILNKKSSL